MKVKGVYTRADVLAMDYQTFFKVLVECEEEEKRRIAAAESRG